MALVADILDLGADVEILKDEGRVGRLFRLTTGGRS